MSAEDAKRWCDVNFGVGGDGIIFAMPPQGDTDFSMRIFNSDGSEPEMCGNGIRCLAKFVADADGVDSASYRIHTLAGVHGVLSSNCRSAHHSGVVNHAITSVCSHLILPVLSVGIGIQSACVQGSWCCRVLPDSNRSATAHLLLIAFRPHRSGAAGGWPRESGHGQADSECTRRAYDSSWERGRYSSCSAS